MGAERQILVVEDEVITAMDIQRRLKKMGYDVPVIATTGEEAIKMAKENNPDLILMDIHLYGVMDGIEAASRISSFSNIPIIYLTAYTDNMTLGRARITEPYAYIIKPFKDRELQISIEIAFYKNSMERKLKDNYERLKESELWLSAVINGIGDAVIAADLKGIIKLMNPIASMLTGWKEEDAIGKFLPEVFRIVSDDMTKHVEDPVEKVVNEGMFYGLADNTVLISKTGNRIPVDILGSPILDNGNVIGAVVVFYDILERKEVEFRLEKKS